MGLNERSVYLDSCLVIYLIEENPSYAPKLEIELAKLADTTIRISPLTEMECLIMPFRRQNKLLIEKFKNWFAQTERLPINRIIFHQSARLRADFPGLKTPDALHLSTALHYDCDEFWTNDNRLNKIAPDFSVNVLVVN